MQVVSNIHAYLKPEKEKTQPRGDQGRYPDQAPSPVIEFSRLTRQQVVEIVLDKNDFVYETDSQHSDALLLTKHR